MHNSVRSISSMVSINGFITKSFFIVQKFMIFQIRNVFFSNFTKMKLCIRQISDYINIVVIMISEHLFVGSSMSKQ